MSGTHQNLKILGTAGYRVPGKFQNLGTARYRVPKKFEKLGTDGYRVPAKKIFWVPIGTGYRSNFQRCRPVLSNLKHFLVFFSEYLGFTNTYPVISSFLRFSHIAKKYYQKLSLNIAIKQLYLCDIINKLLYINKDKEPFIRRLE